MLRAGSDEREYWTGDDAEPEEREGRGGKEEDGAPSPAAVVEEVNRVPDRSV
jgi:hypothetical protein